MQAKLWWTRLNFERSIVESYVIEDDQGGVITIGSNNLWDDRIIFAEVTMLGEGNTDKDIENCTKSVFKENFEVYDMRHWHREYIRKIIEKLWFANNPGASILLTNGFWPPENQFIVTFLRSTVFANLIPSLIVGYSTNEVKQPLSQL